MSVFTQNPQIQDPGSMVRTHRGDSHVSPGALPRPSGYYPARPQLSLTLSVRIPTGLRVSPVLKILPGAGISGSHVISKTSKPCDLPLTNPRHWRLRWAGDSVVPLNKFFSTMAWGIFLISCNVVLVTAPRDRIETGQLGILIGGRLISHLAPSRRW